MNKPQNINPMVSDSGVVRPALTREHWLAAAREMGLSAGNAALLWQLMPTNQKERRKRIPAAQTARSRGWQGFGRERLCSVSWKHTVMLMQVCEHDVIVRDHDGVRRIIASFPADVDVCPDPGEA